MQHISALIRKKKYLYSGSFSCYSYTKRYGCCAADGCAAAAAAAVWPRLKGAAAQVLRGSIRPFETKRRALSSHRFAPIRAAGEQQLAARGAAMQADQPAYQAAGVGGEGGGMRVSMSMGMGMSMIDCLWCR